MMNDLEKTDASNVFFAFFFLQSKGGNGLNYHNVVGKNYTWNSYWYVVRVFF